MNSPRLWQEILLVALLFAAALVVRVYRLPEAPPGLWLDEAANGLDVYDILQGHHPIFFERNNGREPLFLYWQAAVAAGVGASPFALRLAAALVGALTIPALYVMVRTQFLGSGLPARWMAIWTSLFLAFSYWHLSLSRLGLRAIMLPLLACLTFTFFWRAWHRLRTGGAFPWPDLILCGGFLGLSLYTYTASRALPLLVLVTTGISILFARPRHSHRRQLLLALSVIGIVAIIVFAPLGYDFLIHPDHFSGRATEISIFNAAYGGDHPLLAFEEAARKTTLMFFSTPDPNLRHNPAGRPVFALPLALWLVVGIGVALWCWRNLTYLFPLLWLMLLALPAVLSAQGAPHSLRGIGMLPAALILPVMGMLWAGGRLPGRLVRLAVWLPLPFLLFSSITGVRDYFFAWHDLDKFRTAFLIDYYQMGQRIAQHSAPGSVWVLPISPNYRLLDGMFPPFYTVEFLVRNRADYGSVAGDEARAPARLAELTRDRRYVNLFRILDAPFFSDAPFVFDDTKNLVEFLLQKHGRLVGQSDGADIGMPYKVYEAPPGSDYSVVEAVQPLIITFADRVKLIALDYGSTRLTLNEPATAHQDKRIPDGHTLWAVLRWQAQTSLDYDLKTSLLLRDPAGHLAGQVDNLLVSDRYPVVRVWDAEEAASTYHTLPILPAIPPGRYHLYLKVYEEGTGRIYTAQATDGQVMGAEAYLGDVEIVRAHRSEAVTPEHVLAERPELAPGLALLGFDLPRTSVAPGDSLPLTLYWQSTRLLPSDYEVTVQLLDKAGKVVAERTSRPGGESYPTTRWRVGEALRNWHDLSIGADAPAGLYQLVVSGQAGVETTHPYKLGEVEISGRPRLFTPPPVTHPLTAEFGQQVRLLGLDAPATISIVPGGVLTLTLVWQPLATSAAPLVRFVHLLGADGRPVAQQDTIPCDGQCQATSWLAEEVLLDPALLTLPADLAPGEYRLVTGWYDPTTTIRLPAVDERGNQLANDVQELPVQVVVR
jgi:4-amino-4-deoxy-L-arabinose transferase-like glycosyltransferase